MHQFIIILFCTLSFLLSLFMQPTTCTGFSKKDSSLCLLEALRKEGVKKIPFPFPLHLDATAIKVSIRFTHVLSDNEIDSFERSGIHFNRLNGSIVHFGRIYGAAVPWNHLENLKVADCVERIESAKLFLQEAPLDVSIPEIHADDLWKMTDNTGHSLTGRGITIADFDTGVDVFHPAFWRADGDTFQWIDDNQNGLFDEGIDGVDLNRNEIKDSDETLRFIDANIWDNYLNDIRDEGFQTNIDWLYCDANSNGVRDFGKEWGFTELDSTYGEQIFVVQDSNSNNQLDLDEYLIALGTSKVAATMNENSVEKSRGENLIETDTDAFGHGTSVSGILCGGTPGIQKFTGVAPDADLLVANIYGNSTLDWTEYMSWAEQKGARVMLHEIGSWVYQFLDGSSNLEQAMDIEAEKGIVQVVPAGNLGGSGRHAHAAIGPKQFYTIPFQIPLLKPKIRFVFISILWRSTDANLSFAIRPPLGIFKNIAGNNKTRWLGPKTWVWSYQETSPRGTAKFDIAIFSDFAGIRPLRIGSWRIRIKNSADMALSAECYIADDVTSWSGGVKFLNDITDEGTIDFPATADSAITVASYSTRGLDLEQIGLEKGGLSGFSSRGKRIDEESIMDIAAPGNFDVFSAIAKDYYLLSYYHITSEPGSYGAFGGTSAAGPHVAGAAALLLQVFPEATAEDIKEAIRQGARKDSFTGGTPDDAWGYGKLDASGALEWLRDNL